jgi:hypothetical protein
MLMSTSFLLPVLWAPIPWIAIVHLSSSVPPASAQLSSLGGEGVSTSRDLYGDYDYYEDYYTPPHDSDEDPNDPDEDPSDPEEDPNDSEGETIAIESFFTVEYSARGMTLDDICVAAEALADAYNKLILLYDDPFSRRMDVVNGVDILDATVLAARRRTYLLEGGDDVEEDHQRALQSGGKIRALLLQRGTARNACPGNCSYSNDSLRRRLGLRKYFDRVDSEQNDSFPYRRSRPLRSATFVAGDATTLATSTSSSPESPSSSSSEATSIPSQGLREGLPTVEDIRKAYNDEILALGLVNIFGVLELVEFDGPAAELGFAGSANSVECSTSDGSVGGEGPSDGSTDGGGIKGDKSSKSGRLGKGGGKGGVKGSKGGRAL